MKLIIDIDEEIYNEIKSIVRKPESLYPLDVAIRNGTPIKDGDLISRSELKKAIEELEITEELVDYDCDDVSTTGVSQYLDRPDVLDLINNAPTIEPEELKRVRDICEHWNDESSSFVSACNAFEDILHIFKMGVGDKRGDDK